jgi:hypothetical protein
VPCLCVPSTERYGIERSFLIGKTLGIALLSLICMVAVAAPVAAASAGLVVTDPGTLTLLGAALVAIGVWTRRLFFSQKSDR